MRAIKRLLLDLVGVLVGILVGLAALIALAAYGLTLAVISVFTSGMVIFALFCSLAWLATRTHQTAHLALAYWGYALAGFVAMMLIVVAKEWIVEIPERRQERLARQRMERIGKLRLASPDASFQAWRAVNRGRDRGHGPECAVPFPAIVAAPARDPQTALRAP